jgi:PAS domain S-box-containing protein
MRAVQRGPDPRGEDPSDPPVATALGDIDLEAIIDSLPAMVSCWEIAEDWILLYANEAYRSFWARSPGEGLVGHSGRDITGSSLNPYIDVLEQRALEGKTQQYESVVKDGRGRTRNLVVTQYPVGPTAPRTIFVIAIDVTGQRVAERDAVKGASELQLALALAAYGYATLDGRARIRLVNPALSEILDLTAADLIGRPVWDLVAESERDALRVRVQEIAKRGGRLGAAECLVERDGAAIQIVLDAAFDTEGGLHFGVATFRLASARRAAGEAQRATFAGKLSRMTPAEVGDLGRGDERGDPSAAMRAVLDVAGKHGKERLDLTARQVEVVRLIALGHSNRQIAEELEISAETAKWHVKQVLARTGASTRAEAVARFLGEGMV